MSKKNGIKLLLGFTFLLLCAASFFPEKLWGIHFLAFLSLPQKITALLVAGMFLGFPRVLDGFKKLLSLLFDKSGQLGFLTSLFIVGLMLGLFLLFPIYQDQYGDAYRFQSRLSTVLTELPAGFVSQIYELEFTPAAGRKTVLLLYGLLSYKLDMTYLEVFKWVDAICGIGFILLLVWFVRNQIKSRAWQLTMIGVGCFAPLTQVFYLHAESYAPIFLATFTWLIAYVKFFETRNTGILVTLTIALPFLLKLHPLSWLLFAPLILGWVYRLNHMRTEKGKSKFDLRKVARLIVGLCIVAGLFLYLVVFKDHLDPRHLDNVRDIDRLFLPIVSPDAPLDRYNLFSINHLLDFVNVILHWSVPLLVTFGVITLVFKRKVSESQKQSVTVGLIAVLVLQAMLLFMLNPLVSMPMDWDLFSFPAISLLVLTVVLVGRYQHELTDKSLIGGIVGLTILTSAFVPVNASAKSLSHRLETLGRHVFKTYYLHSNRILISSVGMYGDMENYMERKDRLEIDLRPYAIVGNDKLYANLFMDDGYYYLNTAHDYDKAKKKLTTAQRYNPESRQIEEMLNRATLFADSNDPDKYEDRYYRIERYGVRLMREFRQFKNAQGHFQSAIKDYPDSTVLVMFLMESRFQQGDFTGAYYEALKLVEKAYPSRIKSLRIVIHCALEAGLYAEAHNHCAEYLEIKPDDKLILEVNSRLDKMDRPDELRQLFVRR